MTMLLVACPLRRRPGHSDRHQRRHRQRRPPRTPHQGRHPPRRRRPGHRRGLRQDRHPHLRQAPGHQRGHPQRTLRCRRSAEPGRVRRAPRAPPRPRPSSPAPRNSTCTSPSTRRARSSSAWACAPNSTAPDSWWAAPALASAGHGIELTDAAQDWTDRLRRGGETVICLAHDADLIGLLGVSDAVRAGADTVIRQLRDLGVQRLVLLTGDAPETAQVVADALGITEVHAHALPEVKLQLIRDLQTEGRHRRHGRRRHQRRPGACPGRRRDHDGRTLLARGPGDRRHRPRPATTSARSPRRRRTQPPHPFASFARTTASPSASACSASSRGRRLHEPRSSPRPAPQHEQHRSRRQLPPARARTTRTCASATRSSTRRPSKSAVCAEAMPLRRFPTSGHRHRPPAAGRRWKVGSVRSLDGTPRCTSEIARDAHRARTPRPCTSVLRLSPR